MHLIGSVSFIFGFFANIIVLIVLCVAMRIRRTNEYKGFFVIFAMLLIAFISLYADSMISFIIGVAVSAGISTCYILLVGGSSSMKPDDTA